jgi:uncharacterized repeat protein (TIGR03803 family)
MPSKKSSISSIFVLAIFATVAFVAGTRAIAEDDKVLHSFNNNHIDGYASYAGLIADAAGNLYGTTQVGGAYNGGTVFELSPKAGGGWTETVLYSFGNGTDGAFPFGGLIFDKAGNLYGTTAQGNYADVGGIAFELSPATGGEWKETVLHVFGNGTDGAKPSGSLVFDASGNLYGTTLSGGTGPCPTCGTVFQLSPASGGGWTETAIYNFHSFDGYSPNGSLIMDASGNLYGLTFFGGIGTGEGSAFELVQTQPGVWKKKILHSFGNVSTDGQEPVGGLVADASGNLYGALSLGGSSTTCGDNGCGAVFELSLKANGNWGERIVYNFANNGVDGYLPYAGLIVDASGNLYGTTQNGGSGGNCFDGCGTVFELTHAGGGWSEKILHDFSNSGEDGFDPMAGLIFGPSGNLYGTTLGGGADNSGVVFELKP